MTGRRLLLSLPLLLAACGEPPAPRVEGGTAAFGPEVVERHGCGTCHRIPGIPGADGRTGPPLTAMRDQAYVAGVVPNQPELLVAFILDPQAIDPRSAMPDLGLSEGEARDVAAYLYAAEIP